ncbi:hypothetical protein HBI38_095170 [Parastagonospora nodorum]|nr:hypothetical protein HBH69_105200 [Parastagonospora nodorum]KAH5782065.1 hypothetical protein HBI97_098050 [Parastagonospora nodorum]KAH6289844.1 hypothetical protein HBI40_093080 [Parastagonospora nodorum]KAH6321686.1 hypothetical protein HBI38_095170 [Parastagonospora nodorum]
MTKQSSVNMASSNLNNIIDPQLDSKLVQAPYDILRQIFDHLTPHSQGTHILLRHGVLRIISCYGCQDIITPYECEADPRNQAKRERFTCAYMSAWGPHWKCEEMILESLGPNDDCGAFDVMMRTCKKLRLDVFDHLSQGALIVTDIVTMDALLERTDAFFSEIVCNLKSLEIALNLPLDVLVAIEMKSSGHSARSEITRKDDFKNFAFDHAELWLRIVPALDRLKQLRKLRVWLDHDSNNFWYRINESAILSPLLNLTDRPDIELSIHLPKHADDDIAILPFQVERRRRTGHYPQFFGRTKVSVHRDQFPMFDYFQMHMDQDPDPVENEKWERELWKRGDDMERALLEMIDIETPCQIGNI